jgi:H+/Cl- antiporter ClcA
MSEDDDYLSRRLRLKPLPRFLFVLFVFALVSFYLFEGLDRGYFASAGGWREYKESNPTFYWVFAAFLVCGLIAVAYALARTVRDLIKEKDRDS